MRGGGEFSLVPGCVGIVCVWVVCTRGVLWGGGGASGDEERRRDVGVEAFARSLGGYVVVEVNVLEVGRQLWREQWHRLAPRQDLLVLGDQRVRDILCIRRRRAELTVSFSGRIEVGWRWIG